MKARACRIIIVILAALAAASVAVAGSNDLPDIQDVSALPAAFAGAQKVDLRTSNVPSVVTLRDVIKIPPPSTPVLVKTFNRKSLPDVLKPIFAHPGITGVTIGGRYVAIISTPFHKEYQDILKHELVHAYITMASPCRLPFWFQEGSAVYFSTNADSDFYGEPSKTHVGVMMGKVVALSGVYQQKLQSFHFLIHEAGLARFYKWYRNAVLTGNTDARPLLDIDTGKLTGTPISDRKAAPLWLIISLGAVALAIAALAYLSSRRGDYF